jgi:hypothetical protein
MMAATCGTVSDHVWRPWGRRSEGPRRLRCARCDVTRTASDEPFGTRARDRIWPPNGNTTLFQYYWQRLALGLQTKGLVQTHRDLIGELERMNIERATPSRWVNAAPLDKLPPLPGVSDQLRALLVETVGVYRDRVKPQLPKQEEMNPLVPIPEIPPPDLPLISDRFWMALVEARAIASAHRGLPFPTWLDQIAPDGHAHRRLIESSSPEADDKVRPRVQYWLDWTAGRLEIIVGSGQRRLGRAIRGDLPISVPSRFVGRLLVQDLEERGDTTKIPVYGYAGDGLVLHSGVDSPDH